jgi:hypothetical protein
VWKKRTGDVLTERARLRIYACVTIWWKSSFRQFYCETTQESGRRIKSVCVGGGGGEWMKRVTNEYHRVECKWNTIISYTMQYAVGRLICEDKGNGEENKRDVKFHFAQWGLPTICRKTMINLVLYSCAFLSRSICKVWELAVRGQTRDWLPLHGPRQPFHCTVAQLWGAPGRTWWQRAAQEFRTRFCFKDL